VNAVKETDAGWFRVLRREYIPEAQGIHNFERVGTVIRNFINTIEFNMMKRESGKGRFERAAVADDGIRSQDLPIFDAFLRDKCQGLLVEIDNWLTNLPRPDRSKGDKVIRTGLGMYHYLSEEQDERSFKELLKDEGLANAGHDEKR
jgi:hypothetical protein